MKYNNIENFRDENLDEKVIINPIGIRIPTIMPARIPVPTIRPLPYGTEMKIIHKRNSLKTKDDKRIIHFYADCGGCGWWRLNLIEQIANFSNKAHIINTSILVDPYCYSYWNEGIKAVRIQRQVTPISYAFLKDLRNTIDERKTKTRLIYEIDDIIIDGKMPEYNASTPAFHRREIQESLKNNILLCDEFTVCSKYMKEMYQSFVPSAKITVIPNLATKAWFGHVYDKDTMIRNYEKNKKRPRVLLSCSGSHYKTWDTNPYNENDYSKVADDIIGSRKDFKYVWLGTYPNVMKPFIESGEMETVKWVPAPDYPWVIKELGCQVSIAALADNDFNKSKSAIKYQEACYSGLPFIGQDIECYKEAKHRFISGAELIDKIKYIVSDEDRYITEVENARKCADEWWLDDKIDDILRIYGTDYNDPSRKSDWFIKFNS